MGSDGWISLLRCWWYYTIREQQRSCWSVNKETLPFPLCFQDWVHLLLELCFLYFITFPPLMFLLVLYWYFHLWHDTLGKPTPELRCVWAEKFVAKIILKTPNKRTFQILPALMNQWIHALYSLHRSVAWNTRPMYSTLHSLLKCFFFLSQSRRAQIRSSQKSVYSHRRSQPSILVDQFHSDYVWAIPILRHRFAKTAARLHKHLERGKRSVVAFFYFFTGRNMVSFMKDEAKQKRWCPVPFSSQHFKCIFPTANVDVIQIP